MVLRVAHVGEKKLSKELEWVLRVDASWMIASEYLARLPYADEPNDERLLPRADGYGVTWRMGPAAVFVLAATSSSGRAHPELRWTEQ